jgi:hypothetical protein
VSAARTSEESGRPCRAVAGECFIPNGSGQHAAQNLADRLRKQGLDARIVTLPEGHDPNSWFVQGGDAQQFHALLERFSHEVPRS